MNKSVITLAGLAALLVLTYVGVAQLQTGKGKALENKESQVNEITLDSGLKYIIEKHGTSNTSPTPGDVVEVHYTGWLNDSGKPGKKFDSSVDRGTPFKFNVGLGQVIKGWDEAVLSMHLGEKRRIFLPPELGYGAYGAPPLIPPQANLIFDVELLRNLSEEARKAATTKTENAEATKAAREKKS